MILVGRIVRPHGHRGAVVVAPESDFAEERFRQGAELQWLEDGNASPVRVHASREFKGRWIVTFEGVTSMNHAELLRGRELRVAPDQVRELTAGRFYVHELRGCRVVTLDGEVVGEVTDVMFGSGTPVLVVKDDRDREVMVPLAEDICRTIDPAGGRIVIDPPAGLIELNRAAE